MTNTTAHRLTPIESQRVTAILEEALEKLSFLGSITPDILQHRDELSQIVGDEISRIIQEQRVLEARYEELIGQRSTLKGLANKSKFKENQKEIQAVSKSLRESTKNLCRNLKDNPNIGGNLLKIQNERQALMELIGSTIRDLKDGSYDTLIAQVAEDKQAQDRVHEIIQREKETTESVKQLDQDLAREKLEHQREVAEQKATISSLKEELLKIKSKTQVDIKYARKEARAKTASTMRMYNQIVKEQETIIEGLEKKSEMEQMVHKETMEFLQLKQEQLVNECAEWGEKYQTECEAKQNELQKLTEERNNNLEKLGALRQRWEEELAMSKAKEAERMRLQELEELRKEETTKKNDAARVIQLAFRSFSAKNGEKRRKEESEKKGKKKKGKKGGKKK